MRPVTIESRPQEWGGRGRHGLQRHVEPRHQESRKLAKRMFNEDAAGLAVSHRDAATVDGAFDRIPKRRSTQILDLFAGDKSHLSKPGGDPVDSVNSDDVACWPGRSWSSVVNSPLSLLRISLSKHKFR